MKITFLLLLPALLMASSQHQVARALLAHPHLTLRHGKQKRTHAHAKRGNKARSVKTAKVQPLVTAHAKSKPVALIHVPARGLFVDPWHPPLISAAAPQVDSVKMVQSSADPVLVRTSASPLPAWIAHARNLSGASDTVRNYSIAALKSTKNLEAVLRLALTQSSRFLAMDVISALKLKNLIPDLVTLSENDATGTYYLTLNSLITAFNEKEYKELYAKRLLSGNAEPAARMILLDTLLRMRFRLSPKQLSQFLFDDPSPEVRESALYYLRTTLLNEHYDDFMPLLLEVLKEKKSSPQRRIQALFIASQLKPELFVSLQSMRSPCPEPKPEALREVCSRFTQAGAAK